MGKSNRTNPKRMRVQFSLRFMFGAMTILALLFIYAGWERERCQKGDSAIAEMRRLGGCIHDDTHFSFPGHKRIRHRRSEWMKAICGNDDFRHIWSIWLTRKPNCPFNIASVSTFPNLTEIVLSGPTVNDAMLLQWKSPKYLERLTIKGSPITDKGLLPILKSSQLEQLAVRNTRVSGSGLTPIGQLTLKRLYISNAEVNDAGIKVFSQMTSLEELDISHNNMMTDAGIECLANLHDLRVLRMEGTAITDSGCLPLSHLDRLQVLDLRATGITDSGIVSLCKMKDLRYLDISHTWASDTALECLSRSESLSAILLHDTCITGQGLRVLASMPSLKHVGFDLSKATMGGLQHLEKCRGLEKISIFGDVEVTEGLAASFQRIVAANQNLMVLEVWAPMSVEVFDKIRTAKPSLDFRSNPD